VATSTAGEHFVRHCTELVEVAARVDRALAHGLFGTHVVRRAETQARLRHALSAGRLHGERNAEIGDERRAIMQKNVLRLDVTMDNFLSVRVVERTRHFTRKAHRVGDGQLSLAIETGSQRFARHKRHHVVQQTIRSAAVEQRQNVRMLQARGRADLR
jgi:hypothetical protein